MSAGFLVIDAKVEGADAVARAFAQEGTRCWDRVKTALKAEGPGLEEAIRSAASATFRQGHKGSGKLFRSIYHSVRENKRAATITLVAGVRKRAYYAVMLEHGVNASDFPVKEHQRRVKSKDVTVEMVRTHGKNRKSKLKGVVTVKAHRRSMHMAPHPFVTPTYERLRSRITRALTEAVK